MPHSDSEPRPAADGARRKRSGGDVIISARDVTVEFGSKTVLDGLSLDVRRGEILGFVGASGTGKSVLLRTILGLNAKKSGTIEVFGIDYEKADDDERLSVEQRWGVLFQHGALFSSLTVLENIEVPMREYLDLSPSLMHELARLKIDLVGLQPDAADKYPAELSGGMIKRAALARALALDPDIVFLDEPTSGLDPIGAAEFDELIMTLRDTLGLTVYMVTHDLDSLYTACDRIAVLGQKRVLVEGSLDELLAFDDPWVRSYFHGKRARSIDVTEMNQPPQGVA
ncbi:ABC transporter ATP-binding protein [Mangrovicella endophytica]|uniref:ABC transporter ATP-binding protein n=1 Tax=Mangrovicella endophytica TaxID=2066697 RepID=UPI000C9EB1C2|nr:ABC transporter ATP-binding protein [Mangrovicella endophytica]